MCTTMADRLTRSGADRDDPISGRWHSGTRRQEFSYLRAIVVGFGFFSVSVIWAVFNQFVPLILQAGHPGFERALPPLGQQAPLTGFALPASVALFIMTWDNIVNVFLQPWVGARSDRTWTRFGRRKPWVLLGVPIALIGFVAIPFAPTVLAIAVAILVTNLGMALLRSPAGAWLGDLFAPRNRSKANGTINIMGGIGGILAMFLGGPLFDIYGIVAPFVIGSILVIVAAAIIAVGVHETRDLHDQPEAETASPAGLRQVVGQIDRNAILVLLTILFYSIAYYALEAGLSSFAVFSLGISPGRSAIYGGIGAAVFLLFALPAGLLGGRYGRHRIAQLGLAGLVVLFLLSYVVIRDDRTLVAMLVIFGILWALVNVNGLPLVYDFGDERHIGAYTGFYYFCTQLAAVLGPTAGGIVVDWSGTEYRHLFLFSTLFLILAWLALGRVAANRPTGDHSARPG